jgi:flagellar protein FliS
MPASARSHYLETEVLTATPQKLHLLLIEAAIRFAEQARRRWRDGDRQQAFRSLVLAQEAVTKMLGSLDLQSGSPLVQEIASVYNFVFRTLVEANRRHDEQKLDEALRVLSSYRETWQLVCRRNAEPSPSGETHPAVPRPLSQGFQRASGNFSWES